MGSDDRRGSQFRKQHLGIVQLLIRLHLRHQSPIVAVFTRWRLPLLALAASALAPVYQHRHRLRGLWLVEAIKDQILSLPMCPFIVEIKNIIENMLGMLE